MLPPCADRPPITEADSLADVCYWHLAEVQAALMNVRFEGNNGHGMDETRCLLKT